RLRKSGGTSEPPRIPGRFSYGRTRHRHRHRNGVRCRLSECGLELGLVQDLAMNVAPAAQRHNAVVQEVFRIGLPPVRIPPTDLGPRGASSTSGAEGTRESFVRVHTGPPTIVEAYGQLGQVALPPPRHP